MDFYGFYTGKEFEAYQYLGAHVWDGGTTFVHLPRQRSEYL